MNYSYTVSREFWQDLNRLPNDVAVRTQRTLGRMMQDPWATELHPEKVKSAESGVHSARVDDQYRIIWKNIKPNNIVFCLLDKHDEAYQRAARKSFILQDGILHIADIIDVGGKITEAKGDLFNLAKPKGATVGSLFVGYRDRELVDFGVPPDLLPHVRSLNDVNQLSDIERLLPEALFNKLLEISLGLIERPIVKDELIHKSLEQYQGGDELHRFVNSDEFKRALTGDMQEWMLFLAAPQRYLVRRNFNGPVRIRGVVGSGKTVIAIHRARHLARQALSNQKRVLFLTFGNRLPGMIAYLLNKLAGENAPELGAIECRSVHSWCYQFLSEHHQAPCMDENLQAQAIEEAIQEIKEIYPGLKVMDGPQHFFTDEIRYVIKGKAVTTLEDYLLLERSGRGTPLQEEERRAVFEVYQRYESKLEEKGICDYDDFILRALRIVQSGEWRTPYQSAVVDELQDLTEATLRLIRAIIPPGSNDLFLVGDGLQRIYPGGVTLSRIQIDIAGRSALLRRNYRNTQEILRAAHAMMENISYDDLEDIPVTTNEPEYSLRHGELPSLHGFYTPELEVSWIKDEINRLQAELGYQENEFAVLYRWRRPYQDLIVQLLKHLHPVELSREPESYFGLGLKHTTFHSAKGLEFKVVFVVGVTDGQMVPKDDWTLKDDALEDYYARERRLLYVAMTRARDLLYITYARGQPSRFLAKIPKTYMRSK